MNTIRNGHIVADFRRGGHAARNSEGSFLRLKNDEIFFAFTQFCGGSLDDDAPSGIVAIRSADEGETWSEPEQLIETGYLGIKTWMSVSMMRMANGDLGMFVLAKHDLCRIQIFLFRSNDEGLSFYEVKECTLSDRKGYYVMNNDRALRLSSGRILLPLSYHRNGYNEDGTPYYDLRAQVFFLYSDDDGRTWREAEQGVSCAVNATNTRFQEPGLVELKDNVLMAYIRTDLHVQYESFSFDDGMSWTMAQPSRFTSPPSPMTIRRSPYNGQLIAVWNPIPVYNGRKIYSAGWGRTPLVYAISRDNGKTYSEPVIIEGGEENGYCYPALFFLPDGGLLAAYCSGGPEDITCLTRLTIMKFEVTSHK